MHSKIARYIISGSIAALISLGILYMLTDVFGVWYLFSSTAAFVCAFFVSFLLQKLWTFKNAHTHDISRQLLLYFLTALVGLSANAIFMYVLVSIMEVWYMLAQVFSSGSIALATFFIYGNVVFNHAQKGRVLIATGLYPPDIGGPATYSRLLETELPKHGMSVFVVSFSGVRSLPKIIRHAAYFLKVCFYGTEAEIIYALDPVSVGLPSMVAAKLLKKRFILRVAGDYAWEQFQAQSAKRKAQNKNFVTPEEFQENRYDIVTELRRKVQRFVAQHADTIVVPSEYLKGIVKQWGVLNEKMKVIYNAFEPIIFNETKEHIRKKLGISGVILLSAGRLVPWKGFSVLIDVVAELKKEIPDIKLYIAGDGPEEKDLRFKIKDLRIENTVILLGRLAHGKLAEYIRAADIFVLNTGYEGFSHLLLEVMAIGTPVITTNVGGNHELIENQKSGLFVAYNDKTGIKNAMRSYLENASLREAVIENGKKKTETFSRERATESLIKLF